MTDAVKFCGCGKALPHNGMCSERWKKRRENNGPSGIKAKVDVVRAHFGDLAEDVNLLRDRGLLVARFKDQYRIGSDVVDADGLRARAKALRTPAAKTPSKEVAHEPGLSLAPQGVAESLRADRSPPDISTYSHVPAADNSLESRIANIERQLARITAAVVTAVRSRRQSIEMQADGLSAIEVELLSPQTEGAA